MHIIEPGAIKGISNETIMSHHLISGMVSQPDIIPQVLTIPALASVAPITSLLASKGNTSKGLKANSMTKNHRVVGNRMVMMPVKGMEDRKGHIVSWSSKNSTKPGYAGEIVSLVIDTNWFSPYDALELSDQSTIVTVVDDMLPEETTDGNFLYYIKMNRKSKASYINPILLEENEEISFAYTNFYEASETAYEKYTFDQWAKSTLTIQRMKHSISGTAEAMKTEKYWVSDSSGTEQAWISVQEMKMLERWAKALEYQNVQGRGTLDENDYVLLKDMKNREIWSGDGMLNAGDGSLKFPSSGNLSMKFLEKIMGNMRLFSDDNNVTEVIVGGGDVFINQFSALMRDVVKANPVSLVEGEGRNKGINATFKYYELDGIKLIPVRIKGFSSPTRSQHYLPDGTKTGDHRAIFASLGNQDIGRPNTQLIQLGDRGFKSGTVSGINKGGENMQTSVDAEHTHILTESGQITLDPFGVAEVYVPITQ